MEIFRDDIDTGPVTPLTPDVLAAQPDLVVQAAEGVQDRTTTDLNELAEMQIGRCGRLGCECTDPLRSLRGAVGRQTGYNRYDDDDDDHSDDAGD